MDNDDDLPSVLFSGEREVTNSPPERRLSMVQAEPVEGAHTRNSDNNNQPILGAQSRQDPPLELQPETGLSSGPSSMGTTGTFQHVLILLPNKLEEN